jgi:hypothetical protein
VVFRRGHVQEAEVARQAGRAEGEMTATLRDHESRFASLQESLAQLAKQMADIVLEVQRMADQMRADREAVAHTAEVLRDSADARAKAADLKTQARVRRRDYIVAGAVVISTLSALLGFLVSLHVL